MPELARYLLVVWMVDLVETCSTGVFVWSGASHARGQNRCKDLLGQNACEIELIWTAFEAMGQGSCFALITRATDQAWILSTCDL